MSEFRQDPISNRWVIIASERALRPKERLGPNKESAVGQSSPFSAGNESMTPPEIMRIPDPKTPDDWSIRVIPNKYPALRIEADSGISGSEIHRKMDGLGAHEIIIESPDSCIKFEDMAPEHAAAVIRVYRDRIRDLARDERFVCSQLFRNSGPKAGATVSHAHAQLIALPVVPSDVLNRLSIAASYYETHNESLFDVLVREEESGPRLIHKNENFVCFAPYASRVPFEQLIVPRTAQSRFEDIDGQQINDLTSLLLQSLKRLKRCLGQVDYNLVFHNTPRDYDAKDSYRWHVEIIPHLTQRAGFEWGTGIHINPLAPETVASLMRETVLA